MDNDGNLNYENMYKDEKKLLLDIRKFTDFKKFMVCYRLAQDKNYNEIYKEFCEELKDKYSDYFNANGDIIVNEKNKSKLEKIKENDREEESKEEEQAKIKRKELESKSNRNIKEEEEFSKLNQEISDDIENEEQGNYWDKIVTNEKSNNQDKIESTEKNEVIQLPLALSKANFSQEEIKEALSTYKSLLEGLDEGELNNNNDNIIDILYDKANEMQLSEKTEEILGIVLPLTYGDKGNPRSLNQMLMDDQRREEFFNQFDQIINQEIVQNQDIELDGELGNAINQYLSEKEENKVINIETIKENNDSSKQEITDKEAKPKLDREQEDLVVDGVFTEFAKNVQIQGGDANDIVEAYQKGAQQNTEKASSDDVIHTTMVADDRENENTGSYIESHKTEKNVRGNSAEEYEDNDKKQDEDSLESEIENSETAEEIGETDVPAQGNNSKIINFPFDYAYNIAKKFKTKISDIKSEYQNVIEFDKISQKNENELNNDENDMLNTM